MLVACKNSFGLPTKKTLKRGGTATNYNVDIYTTISNNTTLVQPEDTMYHST